MKKEKIKEIIKRLHKGESVEAVKAEFKEILKTTDAAELARVEEELINEGTPVEEIKSMCGVHMEAFKDSLDKPSPVPPGHPIHILLEEHKAMLGLANELRTVAARLAAPAGADWDRFGALMEDFRAAENHYIREENVLFPTLNRYGITQPPSIMWMEHDHIRAVKKNLFKLSSDGPGKDFAAFQKKAASLSADLAENLMAHFMKENTVLFPMALQAVDAGDWPEAKRQFDELGYCPFTPPAAIGAVAPSDRAATDIANGGALKFPTGMLAPEALEAILNTLPVDISFVDAEDRVQYFSEPPERIFPRTASVLGLKVQHCHPRKSLHIVERILSDFKAGKRDSAEFWIQMGGKFILIRYYPVRSRDGRYLGCLEVSQDVTGIRKLEGEKRLL
jgi:hypothetical protein